jgi:hypothetical protein
MDENKRELSDLTVIALVTSVLLAPVGWFLGFRARKEIETKNGYGRPFATAAIWIGGIITVGMLAMFGLGMAGASFGEHRGYGFGNHMMWNDHNDDNRGFNNDRNGDGRGMMGWSDNNPDATPSPSTSGN